MNIPCILFLLSLFCGGSSYGMDCAIGYWASKLSISPQDYVDLMNFPGLSLDEARQAAHKAREEHKNKELNTLFKAVEDSDSEQIKSFYWRSFHLINEYKYCPKLNEEATAIHMAAYNGDVASLSTLLSLRADPHVQTKESHNTALHIAANAGVAKVLLKHGADITRKNRVGLTPLSTAFCCAIPKLDVVHYLLKKVRINAPIDDKGLTALDVAIENCPRSIVELLLKNGALVTARMLKSVSCDNLDGMLPEAHEAQWCIICSEHPEDLSDIPCKQRHINTFICKECYDQLSARGQACPYCRGAMSKFGA